MYQPVKNALITIGNKHTYQKIMVVFLFFISAEVNYMLLGPTFIFMNPLFNCSFSDELVDEAQACDRLSSSTSFSIVAKLGLYCDGQADRNVIQSIVPIGSICGLIIINMISDSFGRKLAMILAQLAGILGVGLTLMGGHLEIVWVLAVAQFFCGFSGNSMILMAYFLPSEFCEDQFRQKSIITINYAWSATSVVLGLLFYYYNRWDNFLLFIVLIPMIVVFLFSLFYLVEGPYFLYGKKQQKKCLQSLKTIARYNGTTDKFEQMLDTFKLQSEQKKEQPASLMSVLKNKQLLKMIIILIFIQVGATLYYYGSFYALDLIGFDYGANMIASGSLQLIAFIILSFTITRIPRKIGLIVLYAICIVCGWMFFIKSIKDTKITGFVLLGVIRFFFTFAYTIVMMLLTEVFPMSVQATCAGIIEAIAQSGGILAPIVITLCINLEVYPMIVLSFVALVLVFIPLFFLKELPSQEIDLKEHLIQNDPLAIDGQKQK